MGFSQSIGVFSLEFYGNKWILAEGQLQASLAISHFRTAELPKLFMQGELPKSDTLFSLPLLLVELLQVRPGREGCSLCRLGMLPWKKELLNTFPALPP